MAVMGQIGKERMGFSQHAHADIDVRNNLGGEANQKGQVKFERHPTQQF